MNVLTCSKSLTDWYIYDVDDGITYLSVIQLMTHTYTNANSTSYARTTPGYSCEYR